MQIDGESHNLILRPQIHIDALHFYPSIRVALCQLNSAISSVVTNCFRIQFTNLCANDFRHQFIPKSYAIHNPGMPHEWHELNYVKLLSGNRWKSQSFDCCNELQICKYKSRMNSRCSYCSAVAAPKSTPAARNENRGESSMLNCLDLVRKLCDEINKSKYIRVKEREREMLVFLVLSSTGLDLCGAKTSTEFLLPEDCLNGRAKTQAHTFSRLNTFCRRTTRYLNFAWKFGAARAWLRAGILHTTSAQARNRDREW